LALAEQQLPQSLKSREHAMLQWLIDQGKKCLNAGATILMIESEGSPKASPIGKLMLQQRSLINLVLKTLCLKPLITRFECTSKTMVLKSTSLLIIAKSYN